MISCCLMPLIQLLLLCQTEALRDTTNSVLYTLGQLSREFPEIADHLNKMLKKANLQVLACARNTCM